MEDIDSSNPSPPQTPTQRDFTHNPPLNQSQHSPAHDFFSFMSDLISHPEPDGSMIITADKVKLVANLLGVEKLTSTHTLASLEKITSRIDSIEKSINPPSSSKKISAAAWTSAVKNKPTHVLAQPVIRPPPSKRIINEFKPSSFIIRKVPDSRPFFQKSPSDITKITNTILSEINAKTEDDTPIAVKGVATLPSGDFKFFTQSRFASKWLLEHKHEWTSLCDSSLITPPSTFPVIVHSVPISFTPLNKSSVSELCKENDIDPKIVHTVRWLGNPETNKKSHGSLIINLLDKNIAQKIERGGLFYKFLFLRGAHYKKSPLQCFQCLEVGHTAQSCKNSPICKFCGNLQILWQSANSVAMATTPETALPTTTMKIVLSVSNMKKILNSPPVLMKTISERIHPLPGGSRILSAIDIDINTNNIKKIRLINVYNPPKNFDALLELKSWLNNFNDRKIPSFILIDSNLHNKLWNPPAYPHSHRDSTLLIKTCGQNGFKIISEKGSPTFLTKRSSPTTIDLTWANFLSQKLIHSCLTSSHNHGSDHQSIRLTLNFQSNIQISDRLSCNLEKINSEKFNSDLSTHHP
ncbi:hypothetical protein PGT21_004617 [Puccinia graminis f. sp. tritici]|uniref:Endonuclease/exonuclease/phosphatase domain-containing protein n=1 Tax=Puccinia graminis f. sp. tritici TaxID=56615 RepID=A0A5B0RBX6_PUCGR|nr:hypothetical protein PGT21_004617 [Puccinia graminis f. sp. tritici]KAA1123180.1 hypothetical protein PGTUg99_020123 [Puccinia graminis f. sp. tritici]